MIILLYVKEDKRFELNQTVIDKMIPNFQEIGPIFAYSQKMIIFKVLLQIDRLIAFTL